MRNDERVIYLPSAMPETPDLSTKYRAMPGCVVVRPLDSTIINGIYQVQYRYGAKTRRDCGHVLSAGEGVPLVPGQFVAYRPYDALEVSADTFIFGKANPWYDQIIAEIVCEMGEMKLKPFADWVFTDMVPLMMGMREDEASNAMEILHSAPLYHSFGRVISAGSDVSETLLGKTVEIRKYMSYNESRKSELRIIERDHERVLDFKYGFARSSWGYYPESEIVAEHY